MKNNKLHGFNIIEEREVPSISSKVIIFEHDITKARGVKIENEDNNKSFGIGFRTPPEDSTGVAHILEHTVLGGSKKYQTKEPFMDMASSSLQTFLNAMTFGDKTIYPLASRNETDYHNLMDIYLDAVFNPLVLTKKEIFLQEGWHLRLNEEGLNYNGVVYNEMRGSMSSSETQILDGINKHLLKDTVYAHNSGGDPYRIPDLSYDDFVDFYKKYYHPTNSFIYFYGNGNFDNELAHLQEYLKEFDGEGEVFYSERQKDFDKPISTEIKYNIAKNNQIENKDYLSINWIIGDSQSMEDSYMNQLLKEVLLNSSASPLLKALLKKGIGEDFFSPYNDGIHQVFGIIAKNSSIKKSEEFLKTVEEVLKDIVENGIDENLLEASLNKIEFQLIEGPSHSAEGVIRFIQIISGYFVGIDPFTALDYGKTFPEFRKSLDNGLLEKFTKEKLLENNNRLILNGRPEPSLFEEKDKKIKEELAKKFKNLTDIEIEELKKENAILDKYQKEEDSIESKSAIPRLSLDDLEPKIERTKTNEYDLNETSLLHTDLFTNRIIYMNMAFDLAHIKQEELPMAQRLISLLSRIGTKNRDYDSLSNEIYRHMGSLNFNLSIMEDIETGNPLAKLIVSSRFFEDKDKEVLNLIKEIIFDSSLENKNRIKEIILEDLSTMENSIIQMGHGIAVNRVRSYFDLPSQLREEISGLDGYFLMQELAENFDKKADEYIEEWKKIYNKLFKKEDLIISLTCQEKQMEKINFDGFLDKIPSIKEKNAIYTKNKRKNEAFISSASVQFVSKGYDIKKYDEKFEGSMIVLSNFLSYGYLHQQIRAIGGAYGAGISINTSGLLTTYSYRDPNLENTIKIYNNIGTNLRNMNNIDKQVLNDAIIGSINNFDPPRTPREKGNLALSQKITGASFDRTEKYLKEALESNINQWHKYGDLIDKVMEENYLTVLGSEEEIRKKEELFDNIIYLDYFARKNS